ncbi:hypothetical protein [Sporohalobacter salinus]|uniref:hypothetical protein n=1 Tax=Sporohalobacter salinus TaxID=1494606 RepID=UPI001960FDF1|nr:hypothetical protein [Sporohalobacter salinus]MBM7625073.1 hypothetical protein [Sporohalobacter salinus]
MVEECTSCSCLPYENLCCCPAEGGITVTQPSCQTIPDGRTVGNPCLQDGTSYWTYKFQVDCDQQTRGISSIGILICEDIHTDIITVEENVNGCGKFKQVEFERIKDDPNFGLSPEGFT